LPADIIHTWGSRPSERAAAYPCDPLLAAPDEVLFRAVTVEAAAATVFRWLCQLRVAPYSYDWIDNGGRRSPRQLTEGVDHLAAGQPVMRIFTLAGFEPDRSLTLVMTAPGALRLFGAIAGTYTVIAEGAARCRLVVKLLVRHPDRFPGTWLRFVLPAGDLFMMRKQLLTLKGLAEGGR